MAGGPQISITCALQGGHQNHGNITVVLLMSGNDAHQGKGHGGGWFRRQDEWLRTAGHHQFQQREPGNHCIRTGPVYMRRELKVSEKKYRASALSNLTAIHQRHNDWKIIAYCGAVSAGAGSRGRNRLSVRRQL